MLFCIIFLDRYRELFESKETRKSTAKIAEKKARLSQIATSVFEGKYDSKQLEKLYANIRQNATRISNHNAAEARRTGGGEPKILPLKEYESTVLAMVNVATRIEGVIDSTTRQEIFLTQANQVPTIETIPKRSKTNDAVRTFMNDAAIERAEKSHICSLKALYLLRKEPDTPDNASLINRHKENVAKTANIILGEDHDEGFLSTAFYDNYIDTPSFM